MTTKSINNERGDDIELAVESVFGTEPDHEKPQRRFSGDLADTEDGEGMGRKDTKTPFNARSFFEMEAVADGDESKHNETLLSPTSSDHVRIKKSSRTNGWFKRLGIYLIILPLGTFVFAAVVNDVVNSFGTNNSTVANTTWLPLPKSATDHQLESPECCACNTSVPTPEPTAPPFKTVDASPGPSPAPSAALVQCPICPTLSPTSSPSDAPTPLPTTQMPSTSPTVNGTTLSPTRAPSRSPSPAPTGSPSDAPSHAPTTTSPTESPTAPTGSPTTSPTIKGKQLISEFIAMLNNYYPTIGIVADTFVLGENDRGWEESHQNLADKFARAIIWHDPFVVGAIGSSVTAGHDNCAYDSYEQQLQRTMAPIADSLGFGFEVRNAGQGGGCGDTYKNQIWCIGNLVGDDVDTTHYSWTYFENAGDKEEFHEMFIRWSLMMDKSPIPLIINTGEGTHLTAPIDTLLRKYGAYGFNKLYMQRGLKLHVPSYPGQKWARVGDGVHMTTRYGELITDTVRRDSLGVEFRNWHPGPLLFQTVSDALSLQYSKAILTALDNIKNITLRGDDPKLIWPKKPIPMNMTVLAPPISNTSPANSHRLPSCSNFELPTFGTSQIALVSAGNQPAGLYTQDLSDFTLYQASPSNLIPAAEKALAKCQHADFCRGYQKITGIETNPISFKLPSMDTGLVIACALEGKNAGQHMIAKNISAWINSSPIPHTELHPIFGKCITFRMSELQDVHGNVLSLQFPAASPTFTISHIITL
mgnify:CR=1 FL=1